VVHVSHAKGGFERHLCSLAQASDWVPCQSSAAFAWSIVDQEATQRERRGDCRADPGKRLCAVFP